MPMPTDVQQGGAFDPSRDVVLARQLRSTGTLLQGGIGYGTGTGSTVTQATNRTTGVTINALCGTITTNNTSLAAEAAAAFVVTNSAVEINDVVLICQRSGAVGAMTNVVVTAVTNGSFTLSVMNGNPAAGVAETGSIVINFLILKAVTQ